jgi:hypothetical protein
VGICRAESAIWLMDRRDVGPVLWDAVQVSLKFGGGALSILNIVIIHIFPAGLFSLVIMFEYGKAMLQII